MHLDSAWNKSIIILTNKVLLINFLMIWMIKQLRKQFRDILKSCILPSVTCLYLPVSMYSWCERYLDWVCALLWRSVCIYSKDGSRQMLVWITCTIIYSFTNSSSPFLYKLLTITIKNHILYNYISNLAYINIWENPRL